MKQKDISQKVRAFINLLDSIPPRDQFLLIKRVKEYKTINQTADELQINRTRVIDVENKWVKIINQMFEYYI